MIKQNNNQTIIPKVCHEQVNRAWKKFLRRHGYKYDENSMLIKPIRKEEA